MGMQFRTCSTSDVAAHRRIEFWNEHASNVITDLRVQPDERTSFAASLQAVDIAGIGFAEAVSTPTRVVHLSASTHRTPEPCYLIHLQRGGTCLNRQLRTEVLLEPGDFVLCDGTLPCELLLGGDNRMLVIRIPQDVLKRRLPTPEAFVNRHMPGAGGASGLVSRFAGDFWDQCRLGVEPTTAERLADTICDLLATAFVDAAGQSVDDSTVQALWRLRIRRYVEQHLGDCDLSPQSIAREFRISRRYVHKIFATDEESVSRYILRRRLERCHRALTDAMQRSKTISVIAFEWGFNNTTHFGRVFRERYGVAPSAVHRSRDPWR